MKNDEKRNILIKRAIAQLIDGVILMVPFFGMFHLRSSLLILISYAFYKPVFESSLIQATPGKRFMNLIVTDLEGNRITLKASMIRYVISIFSGFVFCLGFLAAFFNPKQQAIHDQVADTLVTEGKIEGDLFQEWSNQIKIVIHKFT